MTHKRRNDGSPMSRDSENPYRYGYRYVKKQLANGEVIYDQIPMTLEDVYFPEEGDQPVTNPRHADTVHQVMNGLELTERDDPSFDMTNNTNSDFGIPNAKHVRADILTKKGGKLFCPTLATLVIPPMGADTVLTVEVTIPDTRDNDLVTKVDYYLNAKVDIYLIIDWGKDGDSPLVLIGRRRIEDTWQMLTPDSQGRLDLSPFNMLIGTEGDDICMFYRNTGERVLDVVESERLCRARVEEAAQAKKELVVAKKELAVALKELAVDKRTTAEFKKRIADAKHTIAAFKQELAIAKQATAEAAEAEKDAVVAMHEAIVALQEATEAEREAFDTEKEAADAQQETVNAQQEAANYEYEPAALTADRQQ